MDEAILFMSDLYVIGMGRILLDGAMAMQHEYSVLCAGRYWYKYDYQFRC